jgi:hypothetical protein
MCELKNSNYPFSRVDERAHENTITFKGSWYVAFSLTHHIRVHGLYVTI